MKSEKISRTGFMLFLSILGGESATGVDRIGWEGVGTEVSRRPRAGGGWVIICGRS
jgi:hypothetical protein